ncbi:hypothetical protein SAMN05216302_100126 [Nitrosomonas aestuarii]|uniref:Uncharacterized protein n=1 Tax=Nitrosomonas aestuarii TaxID=52441 RepID=A0A1I3WZH7_9PROT|nr:hypothetical protein SAMN05216302_100126 [Nitrosomonas aestuarii]
MKNQCATRYITSDTLKQLEAYGLISLETDGLIKKKFGKHTRLCYLAKPLKSALLMS